MEIIKNAHFLSKILNEMNRRKDKLFLKNREKSNYHRIAWILNEQKTNIIEIKNEHNMCKIDKNRWEKLELLTLK